MNKKKRTNRQITIDEERLKKIIIKYYRNKKYELALKYIDFYGKFMYEINQKYVDNDIEEILKDISQKLCFDIKVKKEQSNTVLFFDSFGFDKRGLASIYLYGLINQGMKVIYICPVHRKNEIPHISKLILSAEGEIRYIEGKNKIEDIKKTVSIINEYNIGHFFLYIKPNDVVPVVTSILFENKINRYLINLTDHAFWLGSMAFDYIIEFRDYGAYISLKERRIEENRIVKLPYYPQIDTSINFQGFPFDSTDKQVIFSGGSLYKTIGDGDKYYLLVKKILERTSKVIFLYAGTGNGSKLEELKSLFPDRVYWIAERSDLYQVMRHADLYLNTYPMAGGLMTQYAAIAGTPPLTLVYDECGKGFLIDEEKLGCDFYDVEELVDYAITLLNNNSEMNKVRKLLAGQVISQMEFESELEQILRRGKSKFEINFVPVETKNFRETYLERLNIRNYLMLWFNIDRTYIMKKFPVRFILGGCLKSFNELKRIINNI